MSPRLRATIRVALGLAVLATLAPEPAAAQSVILLVGKNEETSTNSSTSALSQPFSTGSTMGGYTLTSVKIVLEQIVDGDMIVRVVPNASNGEPDLSDPTQFISLTAQGALTRGLNAFYAPANTPLAAGATYHVYVSNMADGQPDFTRRTASNAEHSGSAAGWSIGNTSYWRDTSSQRWNADTSKVVRIKIEGYASNSPMVTNTAPTAADGAVTTNADTKYVFAAADFNFSDTDIGDALEDVIITTLPSAGTLGLDGEALESSDLPAPVSKDELDKGDLSYTPASDASGDATFNFKVNDGEDDSPNTYVMTVTVTAANNAPMTAAVIVTINEDTPYTFTAADFPFTDDDPGDALENVIITTLPSTGTLSLGGEPIDSSDLPASVSKDELDKGELSYTPAPNASSDVDFSFKVNDGDDDSVAVIKPIRITPVNDAPTVANDIPDRTAMAGTSFSYTFPANTFADADGDTLTYAATKPDNSALPAWLTLAVDTRIPSGTPQASDTGTVSVKVTASDGQGESVSDEFDILVGPALTVSIADNERPALTFSVLPATILEDGGMATVTVATSDGNTITADATIDLTLAGTATKGTDYTIDSESLTLMAGQSSVTATITATNDADADDNETVVVTATSGGTSTPSAARRR